MSANIRYEASLLVISFFTGAGLLIVYDCLRVFRLLCPHRPIWIGVEDMLYWIYTSFMVFTLLYLKNDGMIRVYIVAAVFTGMILYQWLISRNFLKCLKKAIKYSKIKLSRFKK